MRIILRIIMTLVGIVGFFVILAGGALWAYGQYGVPLVETQISEIEDQVAASLEEDYPGSDVTVEFEEIYYRMEGTSFYVAFKVHAVAEIGMTEVANETIYTAIDIIGMVTGDAEFEVYEPAEWTAVQDSYKTAPAWLFDTEEASATGITVIVIGAVAFVGSIIVKAVFLRKRLA